MSMQHFRRQIREKNQAITTVTSNLLRLILPTLRTFSENLGQIGSSYQMVTY